MTKITKLELISFGKFKNMTIEPKDGLNVICGQNEAGKSTVQLFIKSMLYGVRSSKGKGVKERERIIPWGESRAAGRMTLEKDGIPVEIYREFGERPSKDITKVTNASDGEDLFDAPPKGGEVGEKLLGMSENMFSRTVFISGDGGGALGSDSETEKKLINLLSGGSEDVSAAAAEKRLREQIAALKAKDGRSAPGIIDEEEKLRQNLLRTLRERDSIQEEAEKLKADLEAAEKAEAEAAAERDRLLALERSEAAKEKVRGLNRLEGCILEETRLRNSRKFQIFERNIKEDTAEEIHRLSDKIDEIEAGAYRLGDEKAAYEKRESELTRRVKRAKIAGILLIGIGLCCLAAGVFLKMPPLLLGLLPIAGGAALIPYYKAQYNKTKSLLEAANAKIEDTRAAVREREEKLRETLKDFECETVSEFDAKHAEYRETAAKIEAVRDMYKSILGGRDYRQIKAEAEEAEKYISDAEPPKGIDIEAAANRAEMRRYQAAERITELKVAEGKLPDTLPRSDIENNIRLTEEKLAASREELEALNMALTGIRETERFIRSDYTPLLNERGGEILGELTGGKRKSVRVAGDFSVTLKTEEADDLKKAELFSEGTYTQIYLAVRLAVAELTQKPEDILIFLDDVTEGFDDDRAERALTMFKKRYKQGQVILFSCHNRERQKAEKIGGINVFEL